MVQEFESREFRHLIGEDVFMCVSILFECVFVCVFAHGILWQMLLTGIVLGIRCPWQRTLVLHFVKAYVRNVSSIRNNFVRFLNGVWKALISKHIQTMQLKN